MIEAPSRDWFAWSTTRRYSYQFTWLGRPIIQYPQDIVAMQELIWQVRPRLIVETGIAHGGSLVFYASMLRTDWRAKAACWASTSISVPTTAGPSKAIPWPVASR